MRRFWFVDMTIWPGSAGVGEINASASASKLWLFALLIRGSSK